MLLVTTKNGAGDKHLDTYSFFFPLLFDHVGENLSSRLPLSVQKVGWHRSLWGFIIILLFGLPLFMHFDAEKNTSQNCLIVCCTQFSYFSKLAKKIKQAQFQLFSLYTHVFFICIFSACLCLWYSLAFKPISFLALWDRS